MVVATSGLDYGVVKFMSLLQSWWESSVIMTPNEVTPVVSS